MLAEAEAHKNKGNTLYQEDDCQGALKAYAEAIKLLGEEKQAGEESAVTSLRATTLSNTSQVHYELKQLAHSEAAAQKAVANDPTLIKGWFRLSRAQLDAAHPLAAFLSHRTLREVAKGNEAMSGPVQDMEVKINQSLGLKDLSPELRTVSIAGGIGCVAGSDIPNNKLLFIEKLCFLMDGGGRSVGTDEVMNPQDATTEKLILGFIKLITSKRSDKRLVAKWKNSMKGSWPRTLDETPAMTLAMILAALAETPYQQRWEEQGKGGAEEWTSVLLLAIQLRYNKFERGFYRVCALVNHGCRANCAMKSGGNNVINFTTVRDIAAGDKLTVNYLGEMDSFQGPYRRRRCLFRSWLFWCDCDRCIAELDASSPVEQLRCAKEGCQGYVFAPGPDSLGEEEAAQFTHMVDPAIPTQAQKCASCGTERVWSPAEKALVVDAFTECGVMQQGATIGSLLSLVTGHLARMKSFLHKGHWIHRSMLVVLFMQLEGTVHQMFSQIVQSESGFDQMAANPAIVVDGVTEGDYDGGFILHLFRDLWERMEPFYPRSQAYRIHVNIVHLILLGLVLRYNEVGEGSYIGTPYRPISLATALAGLKEHAKDLDTAERASLFNLLGKMAGDRAPVEELEALKVFLS